MRTYGSFAGGLRRMHGAIRRGCAHACLESCLSRLDDQPGLNKAALAGLSMGAGATHSFALAARTRIIAMVAIEPGWLDAKRPYQFPIWVAQRTPGLFRQCMLLLARSEKHLRPSLAGRLSKGSAAPGIERIIVVAKHEARSQMQATSLPTTVPPNCVL